MSFVVYGIYNLIYKFNEGINVSYKISERTNSRINSFLKENKNYDRSDIKKELDDLMALNGKKDPKILAEINKLLSKYNLTSLFKYENKLGGFFAKLNSSYDLNRKIVILSRFAEVVDNRQKILNDKRQELKLKVMERVQDDIKSYQLPIVIEKQENPIPQLIEQCNNSIAQSNNKEVVNNLVTFLQEVFAEDKVIEEELSSLDEIQKGIQYESSKCQVNEIIRNSMPSDNAKYKDSKEKEVINKLIPKLLAKVDGGNLKLKQTTEAALKKQLSIAYANNGKEEFIKEFINKEVEALIGTLFKPDGEFYNLELIQQIKQGASSSYSFVDNIVKFTGGVSGVKSDRTGYWNKDIRLNIEYNLRTGEMLIIPTVSFGTGATMARNGENIKGIRQAILVSSEGKISTKIIKNARDREGTMKEAGILNSLKNIPDDIQKHLALPKIWQRKSGLKIREERYDTQYRIITDYAGLDFASFQEKNPNFKLTHSQAQTIIKDYLKVIKYFNENGISPGDLHVGNISLDINNAGEIMVKFFDFDHFSKKNATVKALDLGSRPDGFIHLVDYMAKCMERNGESPETINNFKLEFEIDHVRTEAFYKDFK